MTSNIESNKHLRKQKDNFILRRARIYLINMHLSLHSFLKNNDKHSILQKIKITK